MNSKHLLKSWEDAWPKALSLWSHYTRLSSPDWLTSSHEEKKAGLTGSFAAIRINDHRVMISLRQVDELGLEDYAEEILAHEIGHHVFCPANLLEAGRAIALAQKALPTLEKEAPMIVNMWEDLLINDRLVRIHDQRHAEIYEKLNKGQGKPGKLWTLYMRAFELLWGLRPGRLAKPGVLEAAEEGDAHLVARMVRVYGKDWMAGVGGFAALCLPYLQKDAQNAAKRYKPIFDTQGMGDGCDVPLGILDIDDLEILHPSMDPNIIGGDLGVSDLETEGDGGDSTSDGGSLGQNREPFLFGQVLEALGMKMDKHDAAVKFYREKALPHLIPFPTQETEQSKEPLMEGFEPWDVGDPMEQIDWMQSMMVSPVPIPGMTTVKRTWGVMGGRERKREPLDLDLYVDCSGSIPNPQQNFSFLALAGAIVVISALRTGARVQATLWSGRNQFDTTPGFISDEKGILRVLTGYLGGSTAFPNHILRETYQERPESERPVHILILSDEGIDTMALADEKGNNGMALSKMALEKARGGGTMVLNLYSDRFLKAGFAVDAKRIGWEMFMVSDWSGLLEFAQEFSRLKYGQKKARAK